VKRKVFMLAQKPLDEQEMQARVDAYLRQLKAEQRAWAKANRSAIRKAALDTARNRRHGHKPATAPGDPFSRGARALDARTG
jgi:hypothetical protein